MSVALESRDALLSSQTLTHLPLRPHDAVTYRRCCASASALFFLTVSPSAGSAEEAPAPPEGAPESRTAARAAQYRWSLELGGVGAALDIQSVRSKVSQQVSGCVILTALATQLAKPFAVKTLPSSRLMLMLDLQAHSNNLNQDEDRRQACMLYTRPGLSSPLLKGERVKKKSSHWGKTAAAPLREGRGRHSGAGANELAREAVLGRRRVSPAENQSRRRENRTVLLPAINTRAHDERVTLHERAVLKWPCASPLWRCATRRQASSRQLSNSSDGFNGR
ncbi:hypothetical protein AOLI_G00060430 [Acnodon oligacanthus]